MTITRINDFYSNSIILITGGTGFVGKVLIQKLLSAFEVQKIYMLIRCKDNMTVEQRLEKFLNESVRLFFFFCFWFLTENSSSLVYMKDIGTDDFCLLACFMDKFSLQSFSSLCTYQIFDVLREERPQLLRKIRAIRTNFSAIDLDIEAADRELLRNEVEVSKCGTQVQVYASTNT